MTETKAVPYWCPRCYFEGSYNGALRFAGQDAPKCKDHGEMVPKEKGKK